MARERPIFRCLRMGSTLFSDDVFNGDKLLLVLFIYTICKTATLLEHMTTFYFVYRINKRLCNGIVPLLYAVTVTEYGQLSAPLRVGYIKPTLSQHTKNGMSL